MRQQPWISLNYQQLASLGLAPHQKTLQDAGEKAARRTLKSFLQVRGYDYRKALSSPLSAEDGCSRLSPHLAFGTLSMRTVHQATEVAIANTPGPCLLRMRYAALPTAALALPLHAKARRRAGH